MCVLSPTFGTGLNHQICVGFFHKIYHFYSEVKEYSESEINSHCRRVFSQDIKYAFINFRSIKEKGSLEVRGLPFERDYDRIIDWLKIVNKI